MSFVENALAGTGIAFFVFVLTVVYGVRVDDVALVMHTLKLMGWVLGFGAVLGLIRIAMEPKAH